MHSTNIKTPIAAAIRRICDKCVSVGNNTGSDEKGPLSLKSTWSPPSSFGCVGTAAISFTSLLGFFQQNFEFLVFFLVLARDLENVMLDRAITPAPERVGGYL